MGKLREKFKITSLRPCLFIGAKSWWRHFARQWFKLMYTWSTCTLILDTVTLIYHSTLTLMKVGQS